MDNFSFYSPTEFVFGKDTEQNCGKLVKKYSGNRVLIVYGTGSVVRSGLLDRVKASLDAENLTYFEVSGILPNPRDTKVYEGIDICRKENVDFILSVGGGSCIDTAKGIAGGVCYDGDFWELYSGKAYVQKALPIGTVLTIAAAGSEGSGASVITREKDMLKRDTGSDLLRPKFSVLNPQLTTTLPLYQTACGITDIMAHVFERYFTNTKDVEITDRLCEAVLLTMIKEAKTIIKNPEDYQARANIMWAGTVAHTDLVGVGRSQDWNSHKIEHELSGLYDCAHGAGLAVVMPAWMEYVYHHDVERFAQCARRLWNVDIADNEEAAKEGIRQFRAFLTEIGMPTDFEQLGAKEEDIPVLVENLGLTGKLGGFMELSAEDVSNILHIATKGGTV